MDEHNIRDPKINRKMCHFWELQHKTFVVKQQIYLYLIKLPKACKASLFFESILAVYFIGVLLKNHKVLS